ncbi:DUF2939 domain-containing protein [Psychrobacter lutiphocae]|uniref:DUF2939 domain-containing protein n=1 Tax=Psychrobacter lutiphocae TaxID=540500 RepID=UPI0003816872|nr:DUF2939 domain-containing protein [Psychrobacter lutiphocae]
MKKPLIWIAGVIVIIAIYLYASPYLVLRNIKNAAVEGNADVLSDYIDFPSVKQSLKDQINAQIMEDVAKEDTDGFEALGAMMASAMIDSIVDKIVTPDGLALMVQGKKPLFDESDAETSASDSPDTADNRPNIDYKTSYVNYKTFKVTLLNENGSDPVDIIMRRDGLSWKVTRIALANTLEEGASATDNTIETAALTPETEELTNEQAVDDLANELAGEIENNVNVNTNNNPVSYGPNNHVLEDHEIQSVEDDFIDPEVGFVERGDIISDEFAVGYEPDEDTELVY